MGNAGLRRLWKQLFQQGGRDGTFFLAVSLPPFHKHCQIMYCSELEHEERRALEKKYWVLKMVHMYTHFKCKLFSTRRYETYFRTDASQLEPTEWLRGFLLWSALSSPLPSTQGSWTSGDSCSSMLMTLALFSPGTLFIYIYIYTCIYIYIHVYIYIYTHTHTHTHTHTNSEFKFTFSWIWANLFDPKQDTRCSHHPRNFPSAALLSKLPSPKQPLLWFLPPSIPLCSSRTSYKQNHTVCNFLCVWLLLHNF